MASQVESIKWVPGTSFMVDGFAFANPKCSQYFLTHCHSDHTIGLARGFSAGTIYCSAVSARLLALEKGLHPPVVRVLPAGEAVVIDSVTVTAIDANHCPGAVMLLFEVPKKVLKADDVATQLDAPDVTRILHTGDCRWRDELWSGSCLVHKPVDILMLDTTYAIPRYTFPPQEQAIQMMVQMMRELLVEEPATLFVVGSYHIGKERAYLGAAQALGMQVYAPASKRRVLELLDLPSEQLKLLTADQGAQLHVGSMVSNPGSLKPYLQDAGGRWKNVVGFRPTGWSYRASGKLQVWREGPAAVYGVPYSEHSSFKELRACVAILKPKKLIPTVNASNRKSAAAIVDRFADLMDLQLQRSRIDFYLHKGGGSGSSNGGCGSGSTAVVAAEGAVEAVRQQQRVSGGLRELRDRCGPAGGGALNAASDASRHHCSSNSSPAGVRDGPISQSGWADHAAAGLVKSRTTTFAVSAASAPSAHDWAQVPTAAAGTNSNKFSVRCADSAAAEAEAAAGPGNAGPAAEHAAVQQGSELYDLSAVDLVEQQRLLEQAHRLHRLKRSVELRAAAKKKQRLARKASCATSKTRTASSA